MNVNGLASSLAPVIHEVIPRLQRIGGANDNIVHMIVSPEDAYDRFPATLFCRTPSGMERIDDAEFDNTASLLNDEILPYETEYIMDEGREIGCHLGIYKALVTAFESYTGSRKGIDVVMSMHDSTVENTVVI